MLLSVMGPLVCRELMELLAACLPPIVLRDQLSRSKSSRSKSSLSIDLGLLALRFWCKTMD